MGHNPEHYGGGSVKLRRSAPGTVATTILGGAKPVSLPLPDPRRQPGWRIPGVARLLSAAGRPGEGQSRPGRTRRDVGENRSAPA